MTEPPAHATFDEIGERFDEAFTQRAAQIAAAAWIADRTGPRSRVLDLGCGAGWPTAQQLAEAGLDVVGIDISARMLDRAAERVPSAEFWHTDMRTLPAEIGRFDAVVAFLSLMMLPRPDIPVVLSSARELLHPGAPLAVSMVEGDLDSAPVELFGATVPLTAYPEAELLDVITAAGFGIESTQRVEVELTDDVIEEQIYVTATAQ